MMPNTFAPTITIDAHHADHVGRRSAQQVLATAFAATLVALTATAGLAETSRSGTIVAGGADYGYRISGEGSPLLLLHGGLMSYDSFDPILPLLEESHEVIAVDLLGHGRTALGTRSFDMAELGADVGAILTELGYDTVDVLGYSLGGGVALQLALTDPERIDRMVLVSTTYSSDGFFPEIKQQQVAIGADIAPMMAETPMYQNYAALAPVPEDFPRLLDELGTVMRAEFDMSDFIETLEMPVMLVYGDSDMITPQHMIEFYALLGGGQQDGGWMGETMSRNRLAILPGLTHYNIFMSPALAETSLGFINETETATPATSN
ncbi:alpha/beta fold hydrolase [Frigidibacter oleivorans]|uniref:alpha/beta fold hydrolase n=1 Tax=Frigidibacter oleivorans TaxID=2487129 RepID=UPI00197B009C|nr:alpha/beta hydrolase [Frigidibacter oleivorans]